MLLDGYSVFQSDLSACFLPSVGNTVRTRKNDVF
jgi:hypothetical protein